MEECASGTLTITDNKEDGAGLVETFILQVMNVHLAPCTLLEPTRARCSESANKRYRLNTKAAVGEGGNDSRGQQGRWRLVQ